MLVLEVFNFGILGFWSWLAWILAYINYGDFLTFGPDFVLCIVQLVG